jgi:hypothetical protein
VTVTPPAELEASKKINITFESLTNIFHVRPRDRIMILSYKILSAVSYNLLVVKYLLVVVLVVVVRNSNFTPNSYCRIGVVFCINASK